MILSDAEWCPVFGAVIILDVVIRTSLKERI